MFVWQIIYNMSSLICDYDNMWPGIELKDSHSAGCGWSPGTWACSLCLLWARSDSRGARTVTGRKRTRGVQPGKVLSVMDISLTKCILLYKLSIFLR
ncbi:hypothetical protein M758_10G048400 [Ceratodon purpureus]|nr:hypothetical protein M758_10G048400 [Ceratodon purpureus]